MKNLCSIFGFVLITFNLAAKDIVPSNIDLFENKNVLVLGGTGYLGRAITSEVLQYNPLSITIFSRDEVKHFNATKIFGNDVRVRSIIGDIRDYDALLKATKGIDIVFHVAALKRMDLLESNVFEAVKTDIIGSINVFNACTANNVDKVLFISTDKACLPVNTYGACKFVSEKIFTNYDKTKFSTKFMAARFGNILESTGSVIPIFVDKIKLGQDIPLTDARMTRFIVTKEEAVALLFDALRYGVGGEIFIKKLPSMKITDLIEVLKSKYDATNKIKVIGLRPGEKIHEVLIDEAEVARTIEFRGYFIIRPSIIALNVNTEQQDSLYTIDGRQINNKSMSQYSSDMAVVVQDDLAKILTELELI